MNCQGTILPCGAMDTSDVVTAVIAIVAALISGGSLVVAIIARRTTKAAQRGPSAGTARSANATRARTVRIVYGPVSRRAAAPLR